jgi:hypothetical protein
MTDATVTVPTPAPLVRTDGIDHFRNARTINAMLHGRISCSLVVTLVPSATTSVIRDSRISPTSFIGLVPQTAHAAAAMSGLYIVPGSGLATINHASTADADKTFAAVILG